MSDLPPSFGPPPSAYPPASQPPPSFPPPPGQPPYAPPGAGYPPAGQWPSMAPSPASPAPPKRGRGGLIALVVVLVVVLAGAGVAAVVVARHGHHGKGSAVPLYQPSASTTTVAGGSSTPTSSATGSASPTHAVTPPPATPGYKVVQGTKGDPFAYLIPTSWTASSLSEAVIDQEIAALQQTNPQLAAALEQFKATLSSGTAGAKALSLSYDPSGGGGGTVQLIQLPALLNGPPSSLVGEVELGLSAVGGKVTGQSATTVGGHAAEHITVQVSANRADGTKVTVVEQLLIVQGTTNPYVMTVVLPDGAVGGTILQSLRVP